METPPAPHSLLDPTLLTTAGLVIGTAAKTLFDYVVRRLRPHDDLQHERLRQELMAEAEALRKELRGEMTRLREEVTTLQREVVVWKNRYYRLLALLSEVPEVRDRLAAELERIAEEVASWP